jgi:hypothetical protein
MIGGNTAFTLLVKQLNTGLQYLVFGSEFLVHPRISFYLFFISLL